MGCGACGRRYRPPTPVHPVAAATPDSVPHSQASRAVQTSRGYVITQRKSQRVVGPGHPEHELLKKE